MKSKKILCISHVNSTGGAEQVYFSVINALTSEFDVKFLINNRGNNNLTNKIKEKEKIISWKFGLISKSISRSILEFPFTIYSVIKTVKIIKKEKIDVIYSNTSVNLVGILAGIITRKKHIWHIHEQFGGVLNKRFKFLYKILLKYKNNEVIFISKSIERDWNFTNYKKRIIKNPINRYTTISNKEDHIVTLGFAGSLVKNKNVIYILKALRAVKHLNVKLIVAGDGKERKYLEEFSESNKLNVEFLGSIEDMGAFYSKIDMLVLPSFSEGVPLVALEAMYSKKVLILTQNNGLKEIFKEGKDYISINPYEYEDLSNRIIELMDNDAFKDKIIKNSFESIEKYLMENNFEEEIKEVFRDI